MLRTHHKHSVIQKILNISILTLMIYMPFHLFLSRWLSLYTGGLMFWELGKDFLTIFALLIAVYIFFKENLYLDRWLRLFVILTILFGAIHLVFLFKSNLDLRAAVMAILYNGRPLAYCFISAVAVKTNDINLILKFQKYILFTALVTAFIAFLQYLLPKDLMTHFGYSIERGAKPNFFIDDKPEYPRVMSTIRDPNSYGAYLIFPSIIAWLQFQYVEKVKDKIRSISIFSILLIAMILTFSRGSLLGLIIGIFSATYLNRKSKFIQNLLHQKLVLAVIALILITGFSGLYIKNRTNFKNIVLHSDEKTVMADPNELRVSLQKNAINQIVSHPLGHGPGTAGLISISNTKAPIVLTENYFLQIAYEVGFLGIAIYLSILLLILVKVYKTPQSLFRDTVLATFFAYMFVSLLIHLWSNEAVASVWWLSAGLVFGQNKELEKN